MQLRWALSRLRAMGVRELAHRGAQYLRAQLQRAGLGRARPFPAGSVAGMLINFLLYNGVVFPRRKGASGP